MLTLCHIRRTGARITHLQTWVKYSFFKKETTLWKPMCLSSRIGSPHTLSPPDPRGCCRLNPPVLLGGFLHQLWSPWGGFSHRPPEAGPFPWGEHGAHGWTGSEGSWGEMAWRPDPSPRQIMVDHVMTVFPKSIQILPFSLLIRRPTSLSFPSFKQCPIPLPQPWNSLSE